MKQLLILIILLFVVAFFWLFIYTHYDAGISNIFPKPVQDVANTPSSPQIPATSTPKEAMKAVTIGLNQKAVFNDVVIKALAVAEDSRCPSDVECVWAGRVMIEVNVSTKDGTLIKSAKLEEKKSFVAGGARITLAQVEPYPVSTKEIEDGDYVFSFVFEAIE